LAQWSRRHWAATALLAGAAVAATWGTWVDIATLALKDEEQSHLLLVPLVAAWLVWVRRERLRRFRPSATWVGPLAVASGWAAARAGDHWALEALVHLGAILVVVGAVLAVAGATLVTRLPAVFASLVLFVPVPGVLRREVAMPLQTATAEATRIALETVGVAVERSGNMLRVNGHELMIAEACNGLRMVFALMLVSFAFAYGTPLRQGVRVLVCAASPLTAVAANVARLVPVAWAFGHLPEDAAWAVHDLSGWVMIPVAFAFLVLAMRTLRWAQVPVTRFPLFGSHAV
jgi:exosortase